MTEQPLSGSTITRPLAPGCRLIALRSPTLPPATHTNCIVLGDEELVLVDPGSDYPEELAKLDEAMGALEAGGARLREVWITHHHDDHWVGTPHLRARAPGLIVRAHERTAALLRDRLAIDAPLGEGDARSLGAAGRVRVLHTPGHTSGHVAIHVENAGALVAGDLVAGAGTVVVDPPDGDMAAYMDSLRRVRALGLRALWPAHGPLVADATRKLDEYLSHRSWREARILAAIGTAPTALDAILDHAYDDVAAALRPLAARSALAHLAKLVADGLATEGGGRWRRSE